MERDLNLIRDILLFIEKNQKVGVEYPSTNGRVLPISAENITIPEATPEMIYYHLLLLGDAGYVVLSGNANDNIKCCKIYRLTMAGCEYLDTVRNH